jgi:hypothetical protein
MATVLYMTAHTPLLKEQDKKPPNKLFKLVVQITLLFMIFWLVLTPLLIYLTALNNINTSFLFCSPSTPFTTLLVLTPLLVILIPSIKKLLLIFQKS